MYDVSKSLNPVPNINRTGWPVAQLNWMHKFKRFFSLFFLCIQSSREFHSTDDIQGIPCFKGLDER